MELFATTADKRLVTLAVAHRWHQRLVRVAKGSASQWDRFLRDTFGPEGGSTLIRNPNKDGKKDQVTVDWALERRTS